MLAELSVSAGAGMLNGGAGRGAGLRGLLLHLESLDCPSSGFFEELPRHVFTLTNYCPRAAPEVHSTVMR